MKRFKITALLVVATILFSPVFCVHASSETIYVFNANDLDNLAKNCSFDKWSKGKTVVLKRDIDLRGKTFTPVPIFCGTFDGQGYVIKGLSIDTGGSNQGLFRYLAKDGIIKNLSVEGTVISQGDRSNIGGIVGNNEGILENCKFSGYVKANSNVGGVVGINGDSGAIIDCFADAMIHGKGAVGAIAGYNTGTILRCRNESSVNTAVEEQTLNLENLTIDEIVPLRSFVDAIDIGGIVGINIGTVQNSENSGTVGYPHVGRNVGGIVGRQSGYLVGCLNKGKVYGRESVGGIVGLMAPHVSTPVAPSQVKLLQTELNRLQSSITKLLDDVQHTSDTLDKTLPEVQKNFDSTRKHAESLINQLEDILNQTIEEVNRVSSVVAETMEKLSPIVDKLSDVVDDMNRAMGSLQNALYYFERVSGKMTELERYYQDLSKAMEPAIQEFKESGKELEDAFEELEKIFQLLGSLDGDEIDLEKIIEILRDPALVNAMEHLGNAARRIRTAVELLEGAKEPLEKILKVLGEIGKFIDKALPYLRKTIGQFEDAMQPVPRLLRDISRLLKDLSGKVEIEFVTTDEEFKKTKENLFESIEGLSDTLFALMDILKQETDILLDDFQQVSDQTFLIIDMVLSLMDEVGSGQAELDEVFQDVSQHGVDDNAKGKISDCKNFGTIEGDTNAGGIAGAVGFEILMDNENKLNIKDKPLFSIVFKARAVITNCESNSKITGKKNNVGGIVGSMDIGFVKNCVASGSVQSSEGHYVGGIAGQSRSAIHFGYSKCVLKGDNYVGGIVGLGQEVIDCRSIVNIENAKAYLGAIAGYIERGNIVRGNYFVSDVLAAIDGISYAGKAEPIPYEKFIDIEGLPEIFREFKVSFWADDRLVDAITFEYGGSIDEKDIPKVPQKQGYYGRWNGLTTQNLTLDVEVLAEYFPYQTIIESEEKREGPLSVVLVEGQFTDNDRLSLVQVTQNERTPINDANDEFDESKFLEKWRVVIPDDGALSHSIRFIPPSSKSRLAVYVLEENEWVEAKTKRDGKYMVFTADGNTVTFAVIQVGFAYENYAVSAGVIVMIGVATLCFLTRRRKTIASNLTES